MMLPRYFLVQGINCWQVCDRYNGNRVYTTYVSRRLAREALRNLNRKEQESDRNDPALALTHDQD